MFFLPHTGAAFHPNNSPAELTNTIWAVYQPLMLSYFPPFQIRGESTLDFLSNGNVHLSYLNGNRSVASYSKVGLQTFHEGITAHRAGGSPKTRLSNLLSMAPEVTKHHIDFFQPETVRQSPQPPD